MLIQFRVKNFKSFKDDATLYMEAVNKNDYEIHLVKSGNTKVLPIAAIYGANSSGKTNIIEAFSYMCKFIKESAEYEKDNVPFKHYRATPFLFDKDSSDKESEFEVFFTMPRDNSGKLYAYGFCINNDGVTEEWLCSKKKSDEKFEFLFYRSKEEHELELSCFSKAAGEKIKNSSKDKSLILSIGSKLNNAVCRSVEKWFCNNRIVFFSDIDTKKDLIYSEYCPENIESDKQVQEDVATYMNYFGSDVSGFEVERKLTLDYDDMEKVIVLHKKKDSDEVVKIPLKYESDGFRKLFMTYRFVQDVLNTGGVLFADDLDANLHTLALRYLYQQFYGKECNRNHAQLIMTTHDVWFLSNPMLRGDEIWFTDKDEDNSSMLYSLSDFEKDRDTDQDGMFADNGIFVDTGEKYMMGCYGAIPRFYEVDDGVDEKTNIRIHRLPRITLKAAKNN